jgi:hypothetical protein
MGDDAMSTYAEVTKVIRAKILVCRDESLCFASSDPRLMLDSVRVRLGVADALYSTWLSLTVRSRSRSYDSDLAFLCGLVREIRGVLDGMMDGLLKGSPAADEVLP